VLKHQFFGRRFSWVDPQKEIAAKKEEIALMLTDPMSELEARGEDPEELLERFVAWRDMLKARGLESFWDAAFGNQAISAEPETIPDETGNE
jgi:capsid protein